MVHDGTPGSPIFSGIHRRHGFVFFPVVVLALPVAVCGRHLRVRIEEKNEYTMFLSLSRRVLPLRTMQHGPIVRSSTFPALLARVACAAPLSMPSTPVPQPAHRRPNTIRGCDDKYPSFL